MYGKIFKQMYKGTLAMVGPWEALVTFQQMIVLADREGVVDMTADAIARETTIPIRIIAKGVEALELPDPESRTPDHDGRRIIRLSADRTWGWQIVNYAHYRKLRSEEERREYHRNYWREKRSKSANNDNSTPTQHNSTDSTNGSKQYVVSSKEKREGATRLPPSGFELSESEKTWALSQGLSASEVSGETDKFKDYERPRPLKDWHRAWKNWIRKFVEYKKEKQGDEETTDDVATRLGIIRLPDELNEQYKIRVRDALVAEQYRK